MTPLPVNATVRLWREASTGNIMRIESNVAVDLKVEVINVPDGECIANIDPHVEGSLPFGHNPVNPTFRS